MKRERIFATVIAFACLTQWLVACGEADSVSERKVILGGKAFLIPEEYIRDRTTSVFSRVLDQDGKSQREIVLTFPSGEVAEIVPGYVPSDGQYAEDVIAVLAVLDERELDRYRSGERFSDLWFGSGSYSESIVEQDEDSGLYRVFRKVEYPFSWAFLKAMPSQDEAMPAPAEFWVAHCLKRGSALTKSGERVACSSYVLVDDVVVDFEISEQNIGLITDVAQVLKLKVSDWLIRSD